MTDRELLELAAKAAGIPIYESTDGTIQNRPVWVFEAGGAMGTMPFEVRWNPLVEDAQALRLAVKLDIDFYMGADSEGSEAWAGYYLPGKENKKHACEPCKNDPYAATRRAIVRAAAEIGKGIAQPAPIDLLEDNYYKTQAEAFYREQK